MALLDILTSAEATRAALHGDAAGAHGEDIARMNTAVSVLIDELCGPVVHRTVTEYHDGGQSVIWPRQTPLSTVTTVKEWDGTTLTTLTADTWGTAGNADGYLIEQSGSYAHDARIYRRSSGSNAYFGTGHRSVELVYVAGRAATTADVSARFKEAAAAILRRMWKREGSSFAYTPDFYANTDEAAATMPFFRAVVPMVDEFLADERKPPSVA